ncbi:sugar ABC transporter permease [Nocardioides mangrovi]|uniref:Xylose transport system permease protein XylH n=1 Tax=Nocardioides mangrovi TaxID=2874580 RepID=A0ABS7UJH7_9ACTN|nr:ABC transporter permease [Nocardioides mangrovi]MBZ5741166.1 ABC transporter permease [Nocardioides mangrovi]
MSVSTDEIHDVQPDDSASTLWKDYVAKIRGGDVGSLPAILGLVVLVVAFSLLRPETFTKAFNFGNLIQQSAGVTIIAMGLVFVLLLGEIDLAAGYTAGVSAAVTSVLISNHGWPAAAAIVLGLLTGTAIGIFHGLIVSRLGIPSFVVTLSTFLALQGVLLTFIGEKGSVSAGDFIAKLNSDNLPIWLGWVLAVVLVAAYALMTFANNRRRRGNGLTSEPDVLWALKSASLAVLVFLVVLYLSIERSPNANIKSIKGVPISLVIIIGLALVLSLVLGRTRWGSHVYAVGGNAEAARRAGINVKMVQLSCFMMCSTVAAVGGMMLASYSGGVNNVSGGGQTLLYAVGAAVIGGTSLFGGKGRVVDALIGGTVVAVIQNGMGLMNQPDSRKYIVTGLVLLVAASVDAISRRRAASTGRV